MTDPKAPMRTNCGSTGIYGEPPIGGGPPKPGPCPECKSEDTWQSGAPVEKLCNSCRHVWDKVEGGIMYTNGAFVPFLDKEQK